MDGFWMYSGEKSRGLANGLDVKERGIKKKGGIKVNYKTLVLNNMVMPFAEMEEDYEENRLVLGSERKYSVLNILSLRWLLDRYPSQVSSVK